LKPGEYFEANGGHKPATVSRDRRFQDWTAVSSRPGLEATNTTRAVYAERKMAAKADYLELTHLLETIGGYSGNSFVQFIGQLFPYDSDAAAEAVSKYRIGTYDGWTSFPTIDRQGKFCKAKLMKFDPATGKRLKDADGRGLIHSLQAKLKQAGKLKLDFETNKDVFFGEHLAAKYPSLPIAIVESEKTAIIASVCKGVFPDLVWLACGGLSNLKPERLARIANGRKLILFPDANGFEKWQWIASEARKAGIAVNVSDLLERLATSEQKRDGLDLADYLIAEQSRRNDPARRAAFADLIEERLAIMTIDGGLTEEQAEAGILASGFYDDAIRAVCA